MRATRIRTEPTPVAAMGRSYRSRVGRVPGSIRKKPDVAARECWAASGATPAPYLTHMPESAQTASCSCSSTAVVR